MPPKDQSKRNKQRRLNWNKFTDFRSRNSREDLEQLCSNLNGEKLKQVFATYDEVGLLPLHWASIHNRSDLIGFMLDRGCPLRSRCKNKLFADGSALHLAAMNGAIEAAEILLQRYDSRQSGSFKTLELSATKQPAGSNSADKDESTDWLKERDSEGQTALMRCAAPKTKRLAKVRDLLSKNLWSLSGRPAEMALFLIHKGANWRETESQDGMNFLHLAIVNGYADIACLLLVIYPPLALEKAKLRTNSEKSGKKGGRLLSKTPVVF